MARSGDTRKPGKHAARSDATRQALLQAGMDGLLEEPARGVFAHLTAQRVASRAGRTTGAFFHQWPTLEDYRRDLIAYVLDPARAATWARVRADGPPPAAADLVDGVLAQARAGLAATPHDPQTLLEVLMWIRGVHDEEFRAEVEATYADLDQVGSGWFAQLLSGLELEPRPPFSTLTIALVVSALTQGLSVRTVLTPGVLPDDALGLVLLALLPALTRPRDDPRDTRAWLTELMQRDEKG